MFRNYLAFLKKYSIENATILDIGCGAGYFGLELARNGYNVIGIDISESNIDKAKQVLAENTYKDGFGSLEYHIGSYQDINILGPFDVILSSGFMHHIPNISEAVKHMHASLKNDGLLIWHEPQHANWTEFDAAFALSIRLLLSATGFWYDKSMQNIDNKEKLMRLTSDIKEEYKLERDIDEKGGQSPNDLSCDKKVILGAIKKNFDILLTKPSYSYIYRMMGGLRGEQQKLNEIASLLALIDETYVENNILQANYFYGVARKCCSS
jgi:2-polyprenyl-3-methyl-5-hydroxy-6-metoxy-1,4-benzoquinol methylase